MHVERKNKILHFLQKKQSLLILGPRGTGKSYHIERILKVNESKICINLLNISLFKRYLNNPSILIQEVDRKIQNTNNLLVFIDEIQKAPQLLDIVHLLIEKYREKIQFILTGSSARKLKKQNANLLAGRALFYQFSSFSFEEVDFNINLETILQFGLLPRVFLEQDDEISSEILKTYTGTYLKEEIMQESLVRNIDSFNLFLELAAGLNGACVNYSSLAKKIKVSDVTIKEHYKILEDTLIAHKIPAWTFSIKKQLQSSAKYFFFDNGILNALKGELKTELRSSSFRYGDLFENMIVNEIIKYNTINGYDYNLFHYRTYQGTEIDLIVQKNASSPPIAIEIKSSTSPDETTLTAIRDFLNEHLDAKALVLCNTPSAYSYDKIDILPFSEGIPEIFK